MEEPKENLTGKKRTERGTGNHDHASMASRNRDFIKVAEVDLEKHLSTRALQQLSYILAVTHIQQVVEAECHGLVEE